MRRILLTTAVLAGVAGAPTILGAQCGARCAAFYSVDMELTYGCIQEFEGRMSCRSTEVWCMEQVCEGGGSLALSDADGNLVAVAERCGERVLDTVALERRTFNSGSTRLVTLQIE